jgi:hypothetical protein
MPPVKTATQIDRPERFHVEVSDPAEMHEFLERVWAIAARWGFMHTGRFAIFYRQTYGHSSQTTLRG